MYRKSLNIFDIQHFSWHDGPGIRTVIFLKGCDLRCSWCHNPESHSSASQLLFYRENCVRCGNCVAACPRGCHSLAAGGEHAIDRGACVGCGKCAEACYAEALKLAGRLASLEELLGEILKDREFYELSGGGVTISGGEPLLQPEGCRTLLGECRRAGISTAIDTAGHVPWSSIEQVLPSTDLFLYDLKTLDSELHRSACGGPNELILENLKRLGASSCRIIVRIPVIPGFNDSVAEMRRVADFLRGVPTVAKVELLPFHKLAVGKYRALGVDYSCGRLEQVSADTAAFAALQQEFVGMQTGR